MNGRNCPVTGCKPSSLRVCANSSCYSLGDLRSSWRARKPIVNLMIESRENSLLPSYNYYIHDYLCTKYMRNRIDVRPTMTEVMILAFANNDSDCRW